MALQSYRDLEVWRLAVDLTVATYQLARRFPAEERYALASQMQRAAVSIAANIAEGSGRGSTPEFLRFLWISNGSLTELGTHLVIAHRLGYITENELADLDQMTQQIGRMLVGLRRSLESRVEKKA